MHETMIHSCSSIIYDKVLSDAAFKVLAQFRLSVFLHFRNMHFKIVIIRNMGGCWFSNPTCLSRVCVWERFGDFFLGEPLPFLKKQKEELMLACRVLSHELCCLVTWLYWIVLGFLIGSLWSAGPASHIFFCLCSGEFSCSESMKSEDSEATFIFCRQDFNKCL